MTQHARASPAVDRVHGAASLCRDPDQRRQEGTVLRSGEPRRQLCGTPRCQEVDASHVRRSLGFLGPAGTKAVGMGPSLSATGQTLRRGRRARAVARDDAAMRGVLGGRIRAVTGLDQA